MTVVNIDIQVPTSTGNKPAQGYTVWTPTRRRFTDSSIILPAPFTVTLDGGKASPNVDPTTAEWLWRVDEIFNHQPPITRYLVIQGGTVQYSTLDRVNPETLEPYAEPSALWWQTANNTIQNLKIVDGGELHATRYNGQVLNLGNVVGADGRQGAPGVRGYPGKDGTNGTNGTNGLDGGTNELTAQHVTTPGPTLDALNTAYPRMSIVNPIYGDGVTDATPHIQERIDVAVTSGLTVFIPAGRYRITATLNLPSNTSIIGAGKGKTIIDMTGMGATLTAGKTAMQAIGSVSNDARIVYSDAVRGAKIANVTDANTHFAVGDRVLLSSDQTFHVSANLKRGEIKIVEAVDTTTVTFEDANYDSYASSVGAKLTKLTMVKNISLEGFTLEGTDTDNMERGFYCYVGENITVKNCEFNYTDWNSVNLRHVINFAVNENRFRNVHWISNGPNYYGLVVENATAHGEFKSNHGTKCRHLFTTGYTQTLPGVSRFILVEGNVDNYSQSASYDTHDGSEFIIIRGNTSSYSEANGINSEAREALIVDNIIINYASYGVYIRAGAERVAIRGNRVKTNVSTAATPIWITRTYTFRPNHITVESNIIDTPTTHAIYVVDVDVLTLSNNTIGTANTSYNLRLHNVKNARVTGNHATSGSAFLYLQDCDSTIMANNNPGAATYGLRMFETAPGLQTNTLAIGNDFTQVTHTTKIFNPLGTRKIIGNLAVTDEAV